MNTARTFFVLFFSAIIVVIIFGSKWTSGIIGSLGGSLSSVATGIESGGAFGGK